VRARPVHLQLVESPSIDLRLRIERCAACVCVGWIPRQLSQLAALTSLKLYGNHLSGAHLLSSCRVIALTASIKQRVQCSSGLVHFEGTIPPDICQLSSLTELALNINILSGG